MTEHAPILIYKASAGSGKTFQLTYHYIHFLFEAHVRRAHKRILAVTFTNKATAEMKSRILKELHALSQGGQPLYREWLRRDFPELSSEQITERARQFLTELLFDYSGFRVHTIDGFFQQLVRAFSREIGLQGSYQVELDSKVALENGVDNLLNGLEKLEHARLLSWLTEFVEERLENAEYWQPRNNIIELGNEIFKEAYANHAKELEEKVNDKDFLRHYRDALRAQITVFEDKVKALCEDAMRMLSASGLEVADFKGGQKSFVIHLDYEYLKKKGYVLTATFINSAADVDCWFTKTSKRKDEITALYNSGLGSIAQQLVALLGEESEWMRHYFSSKAVLKYLYVLGILTDIDRQVRLDSNENNKMLISSTTEFLKRIIAGSETPFIYERTGVNIDHYMIDEFQDTSGMQWDNFKPLLEHSVAEGRANLLVGDVKQSIYRWRNSDWHILHQDVEQSFDGVTQVKSLDTNYRSDAQVVNFNNEVFKWMIDAVSLTFPGREEEVKEVYGALHQHTKTDDGRGFVAVKFVDNGSKEEWQQSALEQVDTHLNVLCEKGFDYGDIALLVRTKDEATLAASYLLEQGVPVLSNEALQIGRARSVQLLLAAMRYLKRPDDEFNRALFGFMYYRYEQDGITGSDLQDVIAPNDVDYLAWEERMFGTERAAQLQQIRHFPLFKMAESLVVWLSLQSNSADVPFIQAFQDKVHDYSVNVSSDINQFLSWWDEQGDKCFIAAPERQNAVRVMTIHKSKGLEFKAVIIPFCDWGFSPASNKNIIWVEPKVLPYNALPALPIMYSKDLIKTVFAQEYLDEKLNYCLDSLNVAYVAFTRARSSLYVVSPMPKDMKGESVPQLLLSYVSDADGWDGEQYEYVSGELEQQPTNDNAVLSAQTEYVSDQIALVESRLKLRFKNQEYWSVSGTAPLEMVREYGNIMHDLLGRIEVTADAQAALEALVSEGVIQTSEQGAVQELMNAFFTLPGVAEWFSGAYRVLREAEIITPKGMTYRPDRIMIDGKRVVIVDYKFGQHKDERYNRQVGNYMHLVREMGYEPEGYLCYVTLRSVERV